MRGKSTTPTLPPPHPAEVGPGSRTARSDLRRRAELRLAIALGRLGGHRDLALGVRQRAHVGERGRLDDVGRDAWPAADWPATSSTTDASPSASWPAVTEPMWK